MAGKKTKTTNKRIRKGRPLCERQRYAVKPQELQPVDGEITASTPGTSHDSQLSDSDSVEPVGSSRNKLKRDSEDLLVESSDDEARSQTAECEGYRLIDLKNLSSSVSSAHVCKGGENFLSVASSVAPIGFTWELSALETGRNSFSLKSISETCS